MTPRATRLLVTGGRDLDDAKLMDHVLTWWFCNSPGLVVIHGAARGADSLASDWCRKRKQLVTEIREPCTKAEWRSFGKVAGHNRNQRMLDKHKPDVGLAFPGGAGTADMTRRLLTAGVPVYRCAWPRVTDTSVIDPHRDREAGQ